MEAPEKIYFSPVHDALTELLSKKVKGDIEYTRTDVLIEKACEFIKERLSFEDSWHVEGETSILDKVIEDFKKYMED